MLRGSGQEGRITVFSRQSGKGGAVKHLVGAVRERIRGAKAITVLTGAGISAESGVPTFRGSRGLWKNFRAEELATPDAFKRNPGLVWEFYDSRRRVLSAIKPNPAHYALKKLSVGFLEDFTVITQNVDGLHALAGSSNVLELHGNIWRVRCVECGNIEENRDVPIKILPRCRCKGLLRPDVVWFGEMLPENVLQEAIGAIKKAEIVLVVGTSGMVQPAASLAVMAKDNGAFLVEINPEITPLSQIMDITITARAGSVLPELL